MKEITFDSFTNRLLKKSNFPYSVMFEITQRCNLRCKFCYLGSQINSVSDISLKEIYRIVDELKELGCMEITLLGGEPLIRKDLAEIYQYIKKKGILVKIWTNGTLLTSQIVKLFKKHPPSHLRISLYAGSAEGYRKISGNGGAFEKIKKGALLLKKNNVYFTFRTLLTKLNWDEFIKMKEFADYLRVEWGVKSYIHSTRKREFRAEIFKITPEQQAILMEYKGIGPILREEEKEMRRLKTQGCEGCLHISNEGYLLACPIYSRWYRYDLRKKNLQQVWEERSRRNIRIKCPAL
jgi:MoaA/NifB/PqqE/SkfB family radical SAM enzyme